MATQSKQKRRKAPDEIVVVVARYGRLVKVPPRLPDAETHIKLDGDIEVVYVRKDE